MRMEFVGTVIYGIMVITLITCDELTYTISIRWQCINDAD